MDFEIPADEDYDSEEMDESYKESYSAQLAFHHGGDAAAAKTDFLNQRMKIMKEKKKPNASKHAGAS